MSSIAWKILLIGLAQIIFIISIVLSFDHSTAPLPHSVEKLKNDLVTAASGSSPLHRRLELRTKERPRKYAVDAKSVIGQYEIMPKPCWEFPHPEIQLLIAVISKPTGQRVRQAIRETWGSLADPACGLRLFFVLGRTVDEAVQRQLNSEAELHHDILQSNQYEDQYRASTLKTLHLFQWCSAFCPKSLYVLRIDDDVWLNLPLYHKFISHHFHAYPMHAIGKILPKNSPVMRAPTNKYYVPREEYPADKYPAYMIGAIFAVPTTFLAEILWASKQKEHLPAVFLDDVQVLGRLLPAVNLTFAAMPNYADREDFAITHLRYELCPHKNKISIHHSRLKDLYSFWRDPCYKYQKIC
jgi:beta-1,3-galactosyltransferase 1